MWILFLALLILFEAAADILAKEWSLRGHALRWLGAIGAYVLANTFWLFSLRSGAQLSRGAIIFSVVSAMLAVVIGIIFYKEQATRLQVAGMFIGIVAITFILWE